MAVKGVNDKLDNIADHAEQVLDSNRDDHLGSVDAQNDTGEDAQADDAGNLGTDLGTNVNVVGAALLAEGNTVALAGAEAELAGQGGNLGHDADVERGVNVGSDGGEAKDVSVEEEGGVDGSLDVETAETGDDSLEVGRDVSLDVNLAVAEQLDLSLNLDAGDKGNGVEAGLAVLVLGIVLADLGGRGGAVLGELHVDGRKDVNLGLGPGTDNDVADADAGLDVPLLAGRAAARLGPGAVAHGLGALEGLGGDVDGDIDVDARLDVGADVGSDSSTSSGGDTGVDFGVDVHASIGSSLDLSVNGGLDIGVNIGTDTDVRANLGIDIRANTGLGVDVSSDISTSSNLGVDISSDVGLGLSINGSGSSTASQGGHASKDNGEAHFRRGSEGSV